jgi:hypothetical protein
MLMIRPNEQIGLVFDHLLLIEKFLGDAMAKEEILPQLKRKI